MKNSLDYAAMGGMKSNHTGGVKSAKSAASTSRDALPDAHPTGISKKPRDTLTNQLTGAMNPKPKRLTHQEWNAQAEQNVLDFIAEFNASKAKAAKEAAKEAEDAKFAAELKAMSLAGYKRKTSKKSRKRHSSRKKHRKRRTRRH